MNGDTVLRQLHDLGLGAWFGGSLMGAVGVNGAANEVSDPLDRARVASAGWARWTPVQALAIGSHLIGGAGILWTNRRRAVLQEGTRANTVAKLGLTGAALAATAYSGTLGAKVAQHGRMPAEGGAVPSGSTPPEAAKAMKQLRILQFVIPGITGSIVALTSQQGEQQKPKHQVKGFGSTLKKKVGLGS